MFFHPVDKEEHPEYYEKIAHPVDLSAMLIRVDEHGYGTAEEWLDDIYLLARNAIEYNGRGHDIASRVGKLSPGLTAGRF